MATRMSSSRCKAPHDSHNGDVTAPSDEPLPDDIEKLKHRIAKLLHERFGQSSERRTLLDQLELQLFALEEDQAEAETTEEIAAPQDVTVQPFTRRKPARRPLPEHLRRERVVYPMRPPGPSAGGTLNNRAEA